MVISIMIYDRNMIHEMVCEKGDDNPQPPREIWDMASKNFEKLS